MEPGLALLMRLLRRRGSQSSAPEDPPPPAHPSHARGNHPEPPDKTAAASLLHKTATPSGLSLVNEDTEPPKQTLEPTDVYEVLKEGSRHPSLMHLPLLKSLDLHGNLSERPEIEWLNEDGETLVNELPEELSRNIGELRLHIDAWFNETGSEKPAVEHQRLKRSRNVGEQSRLELLLKKDSMPLGSPMEKTPAEAAWPPETKVDKVLGELFQNVEELPQLKLLFKKDLVSRRTPSVVEDERECEGILFSEINMDQILEEVSQKVAEESPQKPREPTEVDKASAHEVHLCPERGGPEASEAASEILEGNNSNPLEHSLREVRSGSGTVQVSEDGVERSEGTPSRSALAERSSDGLVEAERSAAEGCVDESLDEAFATPRGSETVATGEMPAPEAEVPEPSVPLCELRELLECPVCLEVPSARIYGCCHGHAVCGRCRARCSRCPLCRRALSCRCRKLEQLRDRVAWAEEGPARPAGPPTNHEIVFVMEPRLDPDSPSEPDLPLDRDSHFALDPPFDPEHPLDPEFPQFLEDPADDPPGALPDDEFLEPYEDGSEEDFIDDLEPGDDPDMEDAPIDEYSGLEDNDALSMSTSDEDFIRDDSIRDEEYFNSVSSMDEMSLQGDMDDESGIFQLEYDSAADVRLNIDDYEMMGARALVQRAISL